MATATAYNPGTAGDETDDEQYAQSQDQTDSGAPKPYQPPASPATSATGSAGSAAPAQATQASDAGTAPQTFSQMQAAGVARPPDPSLSVSTGQGLPAAGAPIAASPAPIPAPVAGVPGNAPITGPGTLGTPAASPPPVAGPDAGTAQSLAGYTWQVDPTTGQGLGWVNSSGQNLNSATPAQQAAIGAQQQSIDQVSQADNIESTAGGTWNGTDAGRNITNGVEGGPQWDPTTGTFSATAPAAAVPGSGVALNGTPVPFGAALPQSAVNGGTTTSPVAPAAPTTGGPTPFVPPNPILSQQPALNPVNSAASSFPPVGGVPGNAPITAPGTLATTPAGTTGTATPNTTPGFDILNSLTTGAQGQGPGNAVQSATQAATLNLLNQPNAYGTQDVKDLYDWESGNIDDQYSLEQKQLEENMAQRGLGTSTINAGNLNDLNIGKRTAQESLAENLDQNYAQTQTAAEQGAISAGNTVGTQTQNNAQSWLQQLQNFGQTGFNNDLATNAQNQTAEQQYQNYILGLLGYGQAAGA